MVAAYALSTCCNIKLESMTTPSEENNEQISDLMDQTVELFLIHNGTKRKDNIYAIKVSKYLLY